MVLVSNTSTLILLAKTYSLSVFLEEVKKIAIPRIVYKEITDKEDSFEVLSIKKEVEKKRISLIDINKEDYLTATNQFNLDEGEAAAYALYKRKNGKAILTDDKQLIKLCRIEGIPFICAMAVIVKMFMNNKLKRDDALDKLNGLYGYGRYSKDIYDFFRSKVMQNGNSFNKA